MDRGSLSQPDSIPQPSSIHILPYELLATILVLARNHVELERGSESVDEVLVLCQVCAHWREVAHNTPPLWILDNFPITIEKEGRTRVSFTATEMFLARSAPLPISIFISRALMPRQPMQIIDALSRTARRWKNLRWESAFSSEAALARIPAGQLDNLETLELRSYVQSWEGPELDVFSSAPRLRDVTIVIRHATFNVVSISWAQLTRLSLMYDSARLCFEILKRCTNVVSVTLQAENWDVLPVISETICLARLEVLTLCARHLTPFLQRFDLPMLKSLSLSLHRQSPTPPPTPLILFLIRSPNLEHLSTNCLLAENTPDVLQHTPSLISLYFRENPVDDAFFAALRYSDTDSVHLVPKLETLELVLVGEEFEESSFAEMLRSRWWSDDELFAMPTPPAVARLKHVAFWREARPLSPEFDQALDMYMAQGLELDGF